VPADPKRFLLRGFHLPELIAKEVSQDLNTKFTNLVYKLKSTKQQTLLDRKQRLQNLQNQFQLNSNPDINLSKYTNIWLIDDIATTGTTLYEVARVIKTQFPFLKIYGVVVASN
jgi:predicted amidophosphoribosyltransferase